MRRDLIILGGSAGSLEALVALVAALPRDLSAAVLLVVHIPSHARSALPQILQRRSALTVKHAHDGELLRAGQVLVAPPDRHLLVDGDRVRLTRGPRECGTRPALDPLLRTAARWAGRRAIGVVLSGALDDGTAGMLALRSRGGTCVVQSPSDASYPSMPQSVIDHLAPDHIVPVVQLAPLLVRLTSEDLDDTPASDDRTDVTASEGEPDEAAPAIDPARQDRYSVPSGFTCPACHGVLWEVRDGPTLGFRCRVGHGLSAESLLSLQEESVEEAMWAANRALEESAAMSGRLAERLRERGLTEIAARYAAKRTAALRRAHIICRALVTMGDDAHQRD